MTWQQGFEDEDTTEGASIDGSGGFASGPRQRPTQRRGADGRRSSSTSRAGSGSGSGYGSARKVRKSWLPTDKEGNPVEVLTEDQRTRLRERAMSLCVWHLGQTAKTRQELHTVMARKDVPEDIVEATLDRLTEMGYLNDTTYAQSFVRSRHEHRRQGTRAITQALRHKGVDAETIAAAVEAIDPEDEMANARVLVERKAPSTRGLDTPKRVNRLVGMLTRKGYSMGTSFAVVREVLAAEGLDEGDEDALDETSPHR